MRIAVAFAAVMTAAVAVAEEAAPNGEQLYSSKGCIGCHGPAGKSAAPDIYPGLAGRDAAYIVEQLKAFRDGTRDNPLMKPMAAGLSDAEIEALAAYLAAQK